MTLWHGRFTGAMSDALWDLSESYSFDHQLWHHDLIASRAHVRGLEHSGLLNAAEARTLLEALDQIGREFAEGTFQRTASDEDIHMAIERRATELAGPTGAKLHTARSRNDQVATTLRLFTRDALGAVAHDLLGLVDALEGLASRYPEDRLPGYTHLQRAQPVLLSHHLRAHEWALTRDVDRLLATIQRLNVSPLGAGALAGTSLPIDPAFTAAALGFHHAFANSLDAVSDRDFVAEALFDLALVGIHCSRMGEELVLWTTSEFGFAQLDDAFTTGSSMLPQKKNSDVAELARGKSGRLVGNLTSLLVTLKGLPLSYNRDLQEDKEPLFDSLRQVSLVVRALSGAYSSLTWHAGNAQRAADDELIVAIDLAEWLVGRGVPFRQAHERVGALVGESVRTGISLAELVARDEELSPAGDLFASGRSLDRRRSPGASGPLAASAQQELLSATVAGLRARVSTLD
jgi:argininosuccinate lyase